MVFVVEGLAVMEGVAEGTGVVWRVWLRNDGRGGLRLALLLHCSWCCPAMMRECAGCHIRGSSVVWLQTSFLRIVGRNFLGDIR
jgi:hypothetical protein